MLRSNSLSRQMLMDWQRLVPGSMVLGQVSQINRSDIALTLPNNLTGYIPLTSISDKITEDIEKTPEEENAEDERDEGRPPDLDEYFSVGRYLRAYVVSTQQEAAAGVLGKKHIQLSVHPRQANLGLKKSDLVVGSMIQTAVESIEDHGLVVSLGLEDAAVKGFIPLKQSGNTADLPKFKEGSVLLCLITSHKANSNVVNLSADPQTAGNIKKSNYMADASSVHSYLPGSAIEILISEVSSKGIAGKAMGVLDVTADLIHSGAAASGKELQKKYTVGSKVKGRVICTFPSSTQKKIGISLLDHVICLRSKLATAPSEQQTLPTEILPLSTIIDEVKVTKVEPSLGLFVDIGVKGVRGFVHISNVSDKKVETLAESAGSYKVGSTHKGRVTGYNSMDGLFIVSLQEQIIKQAFLRTDDVQVGQIVNGTIEKILVGATGVTGLIVGIAEGISGLVPEVHFADVTLQNPEKKFKEGNKIAARVLSTDLGKRQIRLTLKKTLVNSDGGIWKSYGELEPGMQAPGTIINILSSGAVVQFYGSVKGFLPVSEMSESYIKDPKQHFRNGQVVNVHILSVDPLQERMMVSCKDLSAFSVNQQQALRNLGVGKLVSAKISENIGDELVLELGDANVKALLPIDHLVDGSSQKSVSTAKRLRVGQMMNELVVLNKDESKHLVKLSSKPSLVQAARDGRLLKVFDDVVEGKEYHGFVRNITPSAIFVEYAGGMTGLLPKSQVPDEILQNPDFGMRRNQSVKASVLSVDYQQQRFLLTMKPSPKDAVEKPTAGTILPYTNPTLCNAVDETSSSLEDYNFGKLTKAKISAIKDTQINVQLADGVQGRIDVSEVFDTWAEIKDRKRPLNSFRKNQILPVRILGMHDSRNHRFLPITHRGKAPVFELTAKNSNLESEQPDVLTLDKVNVGSQYIVFVNNISGDCVWVNLSPNVRGRIKSMDVSENVSLLQDLSKNFPIGSALKATVTNIDVVGNRLDLSARSGGSSKPLTLKDLSVGMILPGRITKVTERLIMVQLSDSISGPVHLVDLSDDYSKANPTEYSKNQTIRVFIKDIDAPNKRILLSSRPSKVLSSSLPVQDPEISSTSQVKVNDVLRGFVKHVANNGIFISLGANVAAFVRVSDLSDKYLKDWQSHFEVDQLVKGRIIATDQASNHLQMSLKQSHLDNDYKAPLTFADMRAGQTVTGKIRKVEDFGVFVVVDGSANVSGLCHRTELSDRKSVDPRKLYKEGDAVQAMVLKVAPVKRRISFGLKASYFASKDAEDDEDMLSVEEDDFPDFSGSDRDGNTEKAGAVVHSFEKFDDDADEVEDDGVDLSAAMDDLVSKPGAPKGLTVGFDWTGKTTPQPDADEVSSETDSETSQPKKKRKRKAEIKVDKTGDLDAHGPQSVADFERLLLGQPNSSVLWLSYMAFQLELSEVDKAREIAERALKTINIREQDEKLNVWVALLNLENTYGTEDNLDEVFKRACQYNDNQDIHERLISIFIQSGNNAVSSPAQNNRTQD